MEHPLNKGCFFVKWQSTKNDEFRLRNNQYKLTIT